MSRVTMAACPACAGMGEHPDPADPVAMVVCGNCRGAGDLDAARLLEAYECGRRDAIDLAKSRLGEIGAMVDLTAGDLDHGTRMTGERLRGRVGG